MFQDEQNRYGRRPSFENRGDSLAISWQVIDIIVCTELGESLSFKNKFSGFSWPPLQASYI